MKLKTLLILVALSPSIGFPANRASTYTYDSSANNQIGTIDGPRTDVSDVTYFTYHSGNKRLHAITNPLGHVVSIGSYDSVGLPTQMTDQNGLITTFTYDVRNRVATKTENGIVTTFTYDGVGNVVSIIKSSNGLSRSFVFSYDDNRRITQIYDGVSDRKNFFYDNAGNLIQEDFIVNNNLSTRYAQTFDELSRLVTHIKGQAGMASGPELKISISYDKNGNEVTSSTGITTNNIITSAFDALNRLITFTDSLNDSVNYFFSPDDRITEIQDQTGLSTGYDWDDDLDQLNSISSPDTGVASFTYDAAGNVLTKVFGNTRTYTYDALNRLTSITPGGSGVGIQYFTYDEGAYGKGHLTTAQYITAAGNNAVTEKFVYDIFANLTSHTYMIWGTPQAPLHTKTISYSYNDLNELVSMVYPSGREIRYYYTNAGKINKVDLVENGVTTALISSIAYGYTTLVKKFNTNNGLTLYRVVHDFTGRPTWDNLQDEVTGVKLIPAHNIYYNDNGSVERQEWWASNASNGYTYDTLQRVLTRTGVNPNVTENFTYDDIGNITSRTVNGVLDTYHYSPGTNRLASINGGNPRTFTYNGQGYIANDSGRVLSINGYKLMNSVTIGSDIYKYTYSPLGNKRIIKQKNSDPATFYLYGLDDNPIEEFKGSGQIVDYFYLYDTPIAVEKGVGEIYFVHVAPENNAPVAMYDVDKNIVWRADYDAFGKANIVNSTVELNLRSIGQYFDGETGYHYNKARYYDPGIGKYLQPDPIGLIAGTNLYAYVGNNPINRVDPDGRFAWIPWVFGAGWTLWDILRPIAPNPDYPDALEPVDTLPGPVGFTGKVCKVAKGTLARGREAEAKVLNDLGLTKNTQRVGTAEGNSIPDALTDALSVEIKDAARVSRTQQVRIQTDAARAAGRESVLVTGEKTCVSGPCSRAFDRIIRRPDLGPQ